MHAQIITAAELSIGQRLAGAVRADVQAALWETRELVKTFGPRGTVHLLPTRDLPRWTGALAAVPRPLPSLRPVGAAGAGAAGRGRGRHRDACWPTPR